MNNTRTYASFWQHLADQLKDDQDFSIFDRVEYMQIAQIYEIITKVEQHLIGPRLNQLKEKNISPEKDETLKLFKQIRTAVYQCGEQNYIADKLNKELYHANDFIKFLSERNQALQDRLIKYETIEQMTVHGTLEDMVKHVRQQLKSDFEHLKKNHG